MAGITLDVPPAGVTPAQSAEAAYRSCKVDGVCYDKAAPDIQIASLTVPDVKDIDGKLITKRLAFVLKWTGVPCTGAGPAPPKAPTTCTEYQFVDAATAKTLYSMDQTESNP